MVVSQYDWFPWKQLNVAGRFSLFMVIVIIILLTIISLNEFLSMYGLVENFFNAPIRSPSNTTPVHFIIPQEYLRPRI